MEVKGEYTPEIARNTDAQVYRLRDFLLEGKRVQCDIARLKLDIGGSSLSRRIKDCRDYLGMSIIAVWKKYETNKGVKTKVREYYMDQDKIEEFILNGINTVLKYNRTPEGRKIYGKNV